ncbi:hypothetical protein CARUB_v10022352mg [Capsella rubella]|uniref:Galactose oxidase-like Early set domain-containing protein n=1 Tax=Capsella rubella TaxID=81985 RepID=R0GFZ3_9BRAS|nr:aldehyde oxidase GLOX1 [Capsella rubella]EOA34777.1 hypothetical protein CARUB_v10022352mg [Capsella rubella]
MKESTRLLILSIIVLVAAVSNAGVTELDLVNPTDDDGSSDGMIKREAIEVDPSKSQKNDQGNDDGSLDGMIKREAIEVDPSKSQRSGEGNDDGMIRREAIEVDPSKSQRSGEGNDDGSSDGMIKREAIEVDPSKSQRSGEGNDDGSSDVMIKREAIEVDPSKSQRRGEGNDDGLSDGMIKREAIEVDPSKSQRSGEGNDDGSSDVMIKREAIEVDPSKSKRSDQGKGKGKHRARQAAAGPEMNWPGKWELFMKNSGVSAMHAILMPVINKVQFYDATIWRISQVKLPPGVPCHVYDQKANKVDCWAHSVLVDINTANIRPLLLTTDTWCSSGGLTVNGTLVSTGGFEGGANTARYLSTCENCAWVEYPQALAARRWYSTQATLPDGTFVVVGGRDALNYEYILPEGQNNKKLYDSLLLRQTDDPEENNLYPFVWLNTDGNLFIFANNRSILLSPKTNKVLKEFPQLPGGARNYPGSSSSALLPIRLYVQNPAVIPADVLICGGARQDAYFRAEKKKLYDPALKDCARISINSAKPVWKTEFMPMSRVMSDTVILPNGEVLIVNGAKRGSSGWHLAKEPNFSPIIYTPTKPLGKRFKELAPSTIPRMYHSIAIALPDGKVLIGGSNTNDGYQYNVEYPTELRVEKFSPPYLDPALANMRPRIITAPKQIKYGKPFDVRIELKQQNVAKENVMLTMLAPAFTTHSVSMNMRLLMLGIMNVKNVGGDNHQIQAVAPPSGNVAPPGYYIFSAVYNGVPSVGEWIQIV